MSDTIPIDRLMERYEIIRRNCVYAGGYDPESKMVCHQGLSSRAYNANPFEINMAMLLDDMKIFIDTFCKGKANA